MLNSTTRLSLSILATVTSVTAAAQDRPFELAVQVPAARLSEFEQTDWGLGGRLAFRPSRSLAIEGQVNYYPGDLGAPAFSASRLEGLIGLKLGWAGERGGVFATLQGGVVDFAAAPGPLVCVAIYPPPLECQMAGGDTLSAFGFGAAFELTPSDRVSLRLDLGDQLLKYPGPVFDSEGEVRDDAFWDHNFKLVLGLGLRF
jgi:hypothetical protein